MTDFKERLAAVDVWGMDLPDQVTLGGGIANIVAVEHLDSPLGAIITGVSLTTDLIDGRLARWLEIANSPGLDKYVDRFKELNTIRGMVREGVLPVALPIAGYALRTITKLRPERDGTMMGRSAMNLKDVAFMTALSSLAFEQDTKVSQVLTASARGLGWLSVGLGTLNLIGK